MTASTTPTQATEPVDTSKSRPPDPVDVSRQSPMPLPEAQRLADAENAGAAIYLGNWTVGQILNHLGAWANFAFDGNGLHMPWYIRMFGKPMLNSFLKNGLPRQGQHIPNVAGGTLATERMSARMMASPVSPTASSRLQQNIPGTKHPLFGNLSHEQ